MIFADASALIAMLVGESSADDLISRLERETIRLYSALSAWETCAGLCRSYAFTMPSAGVYLRRFLEAARFQMVDIGEREYELASNAYVRFGKGRHPAALNMGDCFAYACAKANRARLLYIGEDFSLTDLA